MCAFVVSPQKILASRVPGLSPKSLAVMQSVPTGFTPAPAGFMIVTSPSVPAGGTGLGDDGLDAIERGASARGGPGWGARVGRARGGTIPPGATFPLPGAPGPGPAAPPRPPPPAGWPAPACPPPAWP